MARLLNNGPLYEEIQTVTHIYPRDGHSGLLRITIGIGKPEETGFAFKVPQNFELIEIEGDAYIPLIDAKFNRDDLWKIIDDERSVE